MHTLFVDLPLGLLYFLTLFACWLMTLFGLPGNWLILALACVVTWLAPAGNRLETGPVILGLLLLLAIAGETVEFVAGSAAAKGAGATRRGTVGALGGAFAGAILGAMVGLPLPIIGSAVAAVLGGAVGALVGALALEFHGGRDLAASWRVGHAAFWGRLFGTLSKAALGAVMVVVAALATFT